MNRHFKKYYFYFHARLLDLLGQYDKSFANFAKVIRFRTFFWDVQSRYVAAYQKSSKNFSIEIHGGIGDFLQHLPFILRNKSARYVVATHFKDAPLFFLNLGVNIEKYFFYSSYQEYKDVRKQLRKINNSFVCPRSIFFENQPFLSNQKFSSMHKKIIGVHMGSSMIGSKKAIPFNFTNTLIQYLNGENHTILLFGTQKELLSLNIPKHKNIIFASNKDVIKNLSLVQYCDLLIGSDSVFKTMASMLKIPTILLHKKSKNNFRDRVFIAPYVKERIMYVYKYKDFNAQEMHSLLSYITCLINLKFNSSRT
jgi:ADP-heptose:LPS heptosyltransferase